MPEFGPAVSFFGKKTSPFVAPCFLLKPKLETNKIIKLCPNQIESNKHAEKCNIQNGPFLCI